MEKYLSPLEYIKKHQNEVLTPSNFTEADLVMFALITLVDLENIKIPKENQKGFLTLNEIMNKQKELHKNERLGLIIQKNINALLNCSSKAKRYKNLKFYNMFRKVNDDTQSLFLTCDLTDDISFILFSGTDDTVAGWMENFHLIKDYSVECLTNAKEYVERNCIDPNKKYIFIGHSKGGMLSCYSFLEASKEIQDKVLVTYDLDGTGFSKEFADLHKADESLTKLKLICPRGSIIGRLFYQCKNATVIKSTNKGFAEHNPASWVVDEEGHFIRCKSFSKKSSIQEVMVKDCLNKMSNDDINNLYNAIYKIANQGNTKTLMSLFTHPIMMFRNLHKLPKAEKKVLLNIPFKIAKSKKVAKKEIEE